MNEYKLIIFDLIDTLAYCKGLSDVTTTLEQGLGVDTIDKFIDGGGIDKIKSVDEAIDKFKSIASISNQQEILLRQWLDWHETFLYDDTIEILEYLKNKKYILAIISNSPPTSRDQLADLGIKEYFDEEIFSYQVGNRKPEPKIFLSLIEKIGIEPSQALMIGDSMKNDINGALTTGIKAILLDRDGSVDYEPKINNLSQLQQII